MLKRSRRYSRPSSFVASQPMRGGAFVSASALEKLRQTLPDIDIALAVEHMGDLVAKPFARALARPWRIAFRPEQRDTARKLAAALDGASPRSYAGLAPFDRRE